MIEKCEIEGCTVSRDTAAKTPQTAIHGVEVFGSDRGWRWMCEQHARQWQQLQVQLPLAIQELHAWGLTNPPELPRTERVHYTIEAAIERVVALRALEKLLRGA
jgi:hypothetical protein